MNSFKCVNSKVQDYKKIFKITMENNIVMTEEMYI